MNKNNIDSGQCIYSASEMTDIVSAAWGVHSLACYEMFDSAAENIGVRSLCGLTMMTKTNGPSLAASAAAAVAGVLGSPARRATPETLSLDSAATQPLIAAENTQRSSSTAEQVHANDVD